MSLNASELTLLKFSMLHAIGVADYSPLHALRSTEKLYAAAEVELRDLKARIEALTLNYSAATALGKDFARVLGRNYEVELAEELAHQVELKQQDS